MHSLCSPVARLMRVVSVVLAVGGVSAPAILLAADTSGIPEIIVTAERREANLQTVPVAVSALSAETLDNRQITDYQDLQSFVPSLKMTNNITSPTNLSPSLRGSLQQDASLIVAESPFGIYVDDVYVGRLNGNNISLNDIERVEVLRGPQGTLYGRNTLAGAIKFVSRTPGEETWLNATAGAGNFDQYLVNASAGGPLGGGFAGSFAGQYNSKDGEFDNAVTGQDTDYQRNAAFRGKLRYMGIENADLIFSASYVDSKNDSLQLIRASTPGVDDVSQFESNDLVPTFGEYTVGTPTFASPAPPPITADPEGETKQTIASLNASYDFGAFTARSITAFVNTKDFFSTDFSGIGTIVGASTVDTDQWSEELQIQGSAFNDRLNYLGGLYYLNERGDQDFGWYFLLPVSTSQIRAETDSYAAFGQVDFRITDALKATAGVRWVRDEKSFSIGQQITPGAQTSFLSGLLACNDPAEPPQPVSTPPDPPPPPNPTACSVSGLLSQASLDNTYTETTPKFGLDYTFEPVGVLDSLLGYVSAARGFKSGGYNGIAIFNLRDAQQSYGPESNWTYEVGVKMDAYDRRLRLNAAYYWADISDLTSNATVGFSFPVTNVGDAEVHGLELELTALPTENLTIFWNAAFQHGAYGKLDPGAAPAQAATKYLVNPRVPQVPTYSFTLGFDYGVDVPLGDLGGRFRIGMDWFKTDEYLTSATNDFVASPYDRLNGFIGLDVGKNWDVRLGVKNIADAYDITSGSRSTTFARQPSGDIVVSPAGLGGFIPLPPREILLTVGYKM
ncbi:MAG: TonB-dependent receptor [Gammaproteobacteria bacterium]